MEDLGHQPGPTEPAEPAESSEPTAVPREPVEPALAAEEVEGWRFHLRANVPLRFSSAVVKRRHPGGG